MDVKTQAATWAIRIVARYAQAAEPGLLSTEEENLHSALATALRMFMSTKAVPEWVKALNSALDQWEKDNRHSGPRVHNLDLTSERVSMRWPDEWSARGNTYAEALCLEDEPLQKHWRDDAEKHRDHEQEPCGQHALTLALPLL